MKNLPLTATSLCQIRKDVFFSRLSRLERREYSGVFKLSTKLEA